MQLAEQQEEKKKAAVAERAKLAAEADIRAYLKTCGKKELIRTVLELTNAWRDLHSKYEALYADYESLKPQTEAQEASKE